ncbi:hypothetical protein [Paractinoplanes globisporus]|uniref:Uncharacterized protein n=1 Tax=Paractinoplanes globisporus TaxID=113565 RepID=A0ABW6WFX9_9ACTN|nr:hypothetical protein [Actinoplanes globisporus]
MAGTISTGPDRRWSAAGWLFAWTVEFLAERVAEPGLRASLEEILNENLGWLGLGDYGVDEEREMRGLLRNEAVSTANATFAADMAGRENVIDRLRELADSV